MELSEILKEARAELVQRQSPSVLRAGREKEVKKIRNCQVAEEAGQFVSPPEPWEGDTTVGLDIQEKYKGGGDRSSWREFWTLCGFDIYEQEKDGRIAEEVL